MCIRAFDRPAALAGAIKSVLAQTFEDLEVVVSDDSGRLASVAGGFGDPRVRYFANPLPTGSVENIRTAFSHARGPLLALLDDDDRWLPGFLAAGIAPFEGDPELGVAFTNYRFEAGRSSVTAAPPVAPGRHANLLPRLLAHPLFPPCAAVLRREVWEQGEAAFPLSAAVVGDATLKLRAAAAGWAFHYVDEPLAVYRLHDEQMSWCDETLAERTIATFDLFRFEDAECERLRLAQVAEARLGLANLHLRKRRFRSAWNEVTRARETAPGRVGPDGYLALGGVRRFVTRWLCAHPSMLPHAVRARRILRRLLA